MAKDTMNSEAGLSRIYPFAPVAAGRKRRCLAFETLENRQVLSAVAIPADLIAEPSGQVAVPVQIDDAVDVRAVEIELSYDTELLDADNDSVVAGSAWTSGSVQVVASVDDEAGRIVASVFAAEGLDIASGNLLEITFTVNSDAVVDNTTGIDLVEVVVNEGEITVSPEPQSGEDSTDGLLTFVAADEGDDSSGTGSLSGYVYVDSNGDGIRDSDECGVPGVQITLTGSDDSGNAVNREVFTQTDGSYLFDELASGTYQLTERQPTAMGDGQDSTTASGATVDDDSIASIVLESSEISTENNFGEAGLFTEYQSIRMFFASSSCPEEYLLDAIIYAEELAGYTDVADAIRDAGISFGEEEAAETGEGDVEGLVITEINYHPSDPTATELLVDAEFVADDFEFIELANISDEAIDLTGLTISGGIDFDFSESDVTTLLAGETLLVVSNQAAFEARYGTDLIIAGEFSGDLNDGGEQLTIVDAASAATVDCWYDDEGQWPTEADGSGYTLERIVLGDASDAASWSIGDSGGSPGAVPNWDSLVDAALEDGTS